MEKYSARCHGHANVPLTAFCSGPLFLTLSSRGEGRPHIRPLRILCGIFLFPWFARLLRSVRMGGMRVGVRKGVRP